MKVWIRRPQQESFDHWVKKPAAAYWRLTGEGGTGKTSLLDHFRHDAEEHRLPTVFMQADRCVSIGERDGVTLLLNLDVANAPEFEKTRRTLLGVKTAFSAAMEGAEEQAKANWDRISELAEVGAEGASAILRGVRDVAKVVDVIFGKANDTTRAGILARPEESLLKALADDAARGGVWLIDTWEKADGQPFETRLDFPSPGRLRTPPRGKPRSVTLTEWLGGVAAWLLDRTPALIMIAGREAPGELGGHSPPLRGPGERTLPLTEPEIAEYLRQALPGLDHADAPLADLRRRSGGVPLLVEWIARLVGEEAREREGDWHWARWPALVRAFTNDDRYGLIHYAIERVVTPATRVRDIWKLALVDELTAEVADILFPAEERDGRSLLREFERLGVVHRARGEDTWRVHDVTRDALESYARHEGHLDPRRNLDIHRALGKHYDQLAGWNEEAEEKSVEFISNNSTPILGWWFPSYLNNEKFSFLIRASYHWAIVAFVENDNLSDEGIKPSEILELGKRFGASYSFSPPSIRAMVARYLHEITPRQFHGFLECFRNEGGLEHGYHAEDAYTFSRIQSASSVTELPGVDFNYLLQKYKDNGFIMALIGEAEYLPMDVRDYCLSRLIETPSDDALVLSSTAGLLTKLRNAYDEAEVFFRRAIDANPKHAHTLANIAKFFWKVRGAHDEAEVFFQRAINTNLRDFNALSSFADFLWEVRGAHDQSEALYRRALDVKPKHANTLSKFAGFLWKVRGAHDEAEATYRRALDADPKSISTLGNFAGFLWIVRGAHDEAEAAYRGAVDADPVHAATLGHFANFLWEVRGTHDEAEATYRRALDADPKNAAILGNFAIFLWKARGTHDEAEAAYRRAVDADPKDANTLSNFASFLWKIRSAHDEAEAIHRRAVDADPGNANILGNFAGFLLARNRITEGEEVWRRALEGAGSHPPDLSLELWFYAYAHLPDRREQALEKVLADLERGVRSTGFDLSANAAAARRQKHPEPDQVEELARRIAA